MKIKKTLVVFIVAMLALCMCSCGFLSDIGIYIDENEAKAFIDDFLAKIEEENYDAAETYLHPLRPVNLEEFLSAVEDELSVDFSSGFENLSYSSVSTVLYDSSVKGPTYSADITADVSETEIRIRIEIVYDDFGYGIYNFNITAD